MITPLFRVRLDYFYYAPDTADSLDIKLLALMAGAMHSELFTGNPACGPYLTAEYSTLAEARAAEAKLKAYLTEYNEIAY